MCPSYKLWEGLEMSMLTASTDLKKKERKFTWTIVRKKYGVKRLKHGFLKPMPTTTKLGIHAIVDIRIHGKVEYHK